MMIYLHSTILWLITFSIIGATFALSDVNKDCIAKNNGTISNDFLIGTWYLVYKFKLFGVTPTATSPNVTFSKATSDQLQEYRDKYNKLDLPHSIDGHSLVTEKYDYNGLVFGQSEAKSFVLETTTKMELNLDGYEVYVFRRINDHFALFWRCALRGHVKWLMARDKNASEEEMQQIIKNRIEVRRMDAERYCSDVGNCAFE